MDLIQNILVPVDFSPCSRAALDEAVFLGRCFGARVEVLHVWHPSPSAVPQIPVRTEARLAESLWHQSERQARERLDDFVEEFENEGCDLRRTLAVGDPGRQILNASTERRFDLIVMGTHGRTGLAHLFLGSLAERIALRAECPVLTVRAAGRHTRAASVA